MTTTLYDPAPHSLTPARDIAHAACQWPSRAARANLVAEADDGHSNLGWHETLGALISHPLDEAGHRLGYQFSNGELLWLNGDQVEDRWAYQGDDPALFQWIDGVLSAQGLTGATGAVMPYTLPPAPPVDDSSREARRTLGDWFALANRRLNGIKHGYAAQSVKPVSVRCWPHHFDIAVLFTMDEGDPETARSVGVGLSPGDGNYDQPYFYCSPWPPPEVNGLPAAPPPFSWHTAGFVSMVASAEAIEDAVDDLAGRLDDTVATAFRMLG